MQNLKMAVVSSLIVFQGLSAFASAHIESEKVSSCEVLLPFKFRPIEMERLKAQGYRPVVGRSFFHYDRFSNYPDSGGFDIYRPKDKIPPGTLFFTVEFRGLDFVQGMRHFSLQLRPALPTPAGNLPLTSLQSEPAVLHGARHTEKNRSPWVEQADFSQLRACVED